MISEETAINIGFTYSLLREEMKQIIINSEASEFKAHSAISEASKSSVLHQIKEGTKLLTASSDSSEALALIIGGKSLTYALEDDMKDVKAMELELKKLYETVTSIRGEMFYLCERKEEMQELNKTTNSRMAWRAPSWFAISISYVPDWKQNQATQGSSIATSFFNYYGY